MAKSIRSTMDAARWRVPRVVRMYAKTRRVTDKEIAAHLGLSRSAVQQRLAGQTRLTDEELAGLAELFGVTVGDFFDPRFDDILGTPDLEESVTGQFMLMGTLAMAA